jgi:hypothetical protein
MLFEAGAAVNAKDALGFTAAMLAARAGHDDALQVLLDAHAAVDAQAPDRATACMMAAEGGHARAVRALLHSGAKVNHADNDGETALAKAVNNGHLEVVKELLAAGAGIRGASKSHPNLVEAARKASHWVDQQEGTQVLQRLPPEHRDALVDLLIKASATEPARTTLARTPHQPRSSSSAASRAGPKPDFASASRRSRFQEAVRALGVICGTEPQPLDQTDAGFSFHVRSGTSLDLDQVHRDFLERGVYVFEPTRRTAESAPERLAALPTRDKYKVISYVGTEGRGHDLGTREIIRWLRKLEASQPLLLTGIGGDFLAGTFLGPVKKPEQLAEQIYEICPDIVDQGCGTVQELAKELRTQRRLFLWWD